VRTLVQHGPILLIIFEWGDAKQGRAGIAGTQSIGSVNGQEIDARDFEWRVQQQIEGMRAQNPEGEIDDAQIRESVWSQMVDEMLIAQAQGQFEWWTGRRPGHRVMRDAAVARLAAITPDIAESAEDRQ
jgi:hypothetical protein